MKTETLVVENTTYEIRQLTMEEGFSFINVATGAPDVVGLIKAAVKINGAPVTEGAISMSDSMKLMPIVMRLNLPQEAASGNA
jgi:hypothetical protein